MRASDKNLTVLSEAERVALYGLPDFDDFQRAEYFALTNEERTSIVPTTPPAIQVAPTQVATPTCSLET